jgi:uncharacterized LabA/DUF88 family protein
MSSAWLFIDYQNVHLSAWESFTSYGSEVYEAQIHPGHFANQVARKIGEQSEEPSIRQIHLYRGIPNPRKQGTLASIVAKQHQAWRADPRVKIHGRPLRYLRSWPDTPAEEKGVDVQLAVGLVQAAITQPDVRLIVASRDTDLAPAVELAHEVRPGCVDIVTWFGQSDLVVDGVTSYILGESAFRASRDPRNYGAEVKSRRR